MLVLRPEVILVLPQDNKKYVEITCTNSNALMYGIMAWTLTLVFVCSILAALTRKLPENYNETRFITFCAFCSLVVFLAFSSTYLAIDHRNAYNLSGYFALGLFVNATVTLFSLFIVKLYAIYFVTIEQWNVRRRFSFSGSSTPSSQRDRNSRALSNYRFEASSGNWNGEESDERPASSRVSSGVWKNVSDYHSNEDSKIENSSEAQVRNSNNTSEIVEMKNNNSKHATEAKLNVPKIVISEEDSGIEESVDVNTKVAVTPGSKRTNGVRHMSLEGLNQLSSNEVTDEQSERHKSLQMLNDTDENSISPYRRTDRHASILSIDSIHSLPAEVSINVSGDV